MRSPVHFYTFTCLFGDIRLSWPKKKKSCGKRKVPHVCLNHVLYVAGVQKTEEEIIGEIIKIVRDTIGPVAAFRSVIFVRALPKTRSGKIPRSSLANLINGKPYKVQCF